MAIGSVAADPLGAGRRWRPIAYAAALALFVATAWTGAAALPERRDGVAPIFLLVVSVLLAPATTACNAAEYAVTARFVEVRVSALQALRVAVLSTAANLLPVPGSALLRVAELRRAGSGTKQATASVVAASASWAAVTGAFLGVVALLSSRPLLGMLLLVVSCGLVALAARLTGAHRSRARGRSMALLLVVEAASAAVGAARLWCCARGLGIEISEGAAVALGSASVLAGAVGIVPGGLGVREALAAAIGPVVGVPAAVAASVAAVDRLIGSAVVGLGTGWLAVADRQRSKAEQ
jgi:uncharacterized membrane protein YbhN (UPF0104 family)